MLPDGSRARRAAPFTLSDAHGAIAQLRVLLADMSNMLASIINAALAGAPDIIVAGRCDAGGDIPQQVHRASANVVILPTLDPGNVEVVLPLLYGCRGLRVVAISADAVSGCVHELRPLATPLPDLSATALADALRDRAGRHRG